MVYRRRQLPRRRIGARSLALMLASTAFVQQAVSAPSDIYSSTAPVIGAAAPKARDIQDGDASVATQTGALNYAYPITVPPGRNKLAPQLALTYSSQASVNGGIAAGWSLAIPEIKEDSSRGRLATRSPTVLFGDHKADDRFTSTLAGNARLVKVPIAGGDEVYGTYFAQGDTSGARYERLQSGDAKWRVLAVDGSTMLFGESARSNGSAVAGAPCTNISENYAPITTVRDAFGNEVHYDWARGMPNECVLRRISWGYNPSASVTRSFAQVDFKYTTSTQCASGEGSYPGAQLDYRTGTKILTGASKLTEVKATAFAYGGELAPSHTRVITLSYFDNSASGNTEACDLAHSPSRLLRSVQESAWGVNAPRVDLPAVTFSYGSPMVALTRGGEAEDIPWSTTGGVRGGTGYNLGWGRRPMDSAADEWPTVETMLLDMDGDGLADRVTNTSTDVSEGDCRMSWSRNPGPQGSPNRTPTFTQGELDIPLPRLRWHNDAGLKGAKTANFDQPDFEHCALNGQVTSYRNVNGTVACHDGSQCAFSKTPGLETKKFCYSSGEFGLQCPFGQTNNDERYRTYLAYRWLDVTADGLPDLVAAVHGDIHAYDIITGNDISQADDWTPFGVPWPACPDEMDRCKDVSQECLSQARNWTDINGCFSSAESVACHELSVTPYGAPGQPPNPAMPREPYQRCEGLYPWLVYKNTGGRFATEPEIKYSPVPLESNTGDSNISGPSIVSTEHFIGDLDGDGILDAATIKSDTGAWQVWRGDGTGGFLPRRYEMLPHFPKSGFFSNHFPLYGGDIQSAAGLIDLNGDGLAEHWLLDAAGVGANVCWANGTGFETIVNGNDVVGTVNLSVKPGENTSPDPSTFVWNQGHTVILGGEMTTKRRIIDVDSDGRPDIVDLTNPLNPQVQFNLGGTFSTTKAAYQGSAAGAVRKTRTRDDIHRSWELLADLIDLDGDGIAESVSFEGGRLYRAYHAAPSGPPRLLRSIDNGRGAITTVTYASMHDSSTVVQSPREKWPDGRPKATPSAQWVVKSVRTDEAFSHTHSTTSQFYRNPRHGADDEGRYAFRGFEEVQTTTPSGAQTIEVFDYMTDWSGRLAESRVHASQDGTETRSIEQTWWTPRELFGGLHRAYHATERKQHTCSNGQSRGDCLVAPAASTKSVMRQASFVNAASQPVLWADSETLLQAGDTLAEGDRRTVSTFVLSSNPTEHRFRPLTTTREQRTAGTWTMFGKTAKTWDPTLRVLLNDEVWVDSNDDNRAITRFVYDMTFGTMKERWKPVQNKANSSRTLFDYDDRHLFVTTETNELGHVQRFTYDYGTGSKLVTVGPNVATCGGTCPPNAPPGSTCLPSEQYETKIDGLGRPLEQWDTISDDGCTFYYHKRSTQTYVDTGGFPSTMPSSITQKMRIDASAPTWTHKRTDLDGLGRPIRETVFVQGSAPADQISTYTYSDQGTLTVVEVPDPSTNTAARVPYLYTYDKLNRPLSIRRPDSVTDAGKSGVDISYDGVTRTTKEVVGAAGGEPAMTKTMSDQFGRLAQVEEQTSDSLWAVTKYSYGPDDNVASIVDPEGVTTLLQHDFAGRRTQVTRGSRVWKYVYDRNGNLVSEQVPGSTRPEDNLQYTNAITYDDLDRPVLKTNGQRALSVEDQNSFGNAIETFDYDLGGNMLGKLRYYANYAPGSSVPSVNVDTRITTQGQPYSISQTLQIAGYPKLTRSYQQDFYMFGGVRMTSYDDRVGADTEYLRSFISYDARALPSSVRLVSGSLDNPDVAVQTRNVVGLVTKRRSALSAGSPDWVESDWSYDVLGRVTNQSVQKSVTTAQGPQRTQVARQNITYYGADDPKRIDHVLGIDSKVLDYTYDRRHQLLTTSSDTTGYYSGAYTYGPAGRLLTANEAQTVSPLPAGSEIKPRQVTYAYDGLDPEQVTALVNTNSGTTYASFAYDAVGNMITKCSGGSISACTGAGTEMLQYEYDGKDQLRRVTHRTSNTLTGSEEYWYDGNGARVAIVKRDANGSKTEMVWFLGDVQSHHDGTTGEATRVLSNVSIGVPVARTERSPDAPMTTEYQFHAAGSSTLAAVGSDGRTNVAFRYSPWGRLLEVREEAGAAAGRTSHSRRFGDKYVDDVSGLAYYGARYYDSDAMLWTQADPLYQVASERSPEQPRLRNRYVFNLQNAMAYSDPDGLEPDVIKNLQIPDERKFAAISSNYMAKLNKERSMHEPVTLTNFGRKEEVFHDESRVEAVRYLAGEFGISLDASYLIVTDFGESRASGAYKPEFDALYINTPTLQDVVQVVLVLVHETVHRERLHNNGGGHAVAIEEKIAYDYTKKVAKMMYQKGMIKYPELIELLKGYTAAEMRTDQKQDLCEPCIHMPGMHENVSFASKTYRQKATALLNGRWGLEINPTGPMAVHQ